MRRAVIRPTADAELDHHARYLANRNLLAGQRLYASAHETFAILAENPGLGTQVAPRNIALDGMRFFGVIGSPMYLIFYRQFAEGIEVVRFMHASQDWHNALLD